MGLYSEVAFQMLSNQGIGASVEVWVEQGAFLQQLLAHLIISVLRATYITCLTNLSVMRKLKEAFQIIS